MYNKNLSAAAPNLSTNDCLRLGSTFHGLHTIAPQIAPVVSLGIERLETNTLVLQCLQTLTGAKFVVTATPGTTDLDVFLQSVYELYADFVLKVNEHYIFFTVLKFIMLTNNEYVLLF